MATFKYSGTDENGAQLEGSVHAEHEDGARKQLQDMNVTVDSLEDVTPKETIEWATIDETNMHTVIDPRTPLPATSPHTKTEEESVYFPISSTLRLYAGWLLAWYLLVYGLGYYQAQRDLPFSVPYVSGIIASPLVLTFTLAAFLYLLCTSIYSMYRGTVMAWIIAIVGIAAFVLYRINV